MANTLLQLRVDEELRKEANELFDKMGIDMSTAIRIFLKRCVQERGIPFEMKVKDDPLEKAINALKKAQEDAKESGTAELTLDEINAEIDAYRRGE